jgi:serine/threonine-protein kinase
LELIGKQLGKYRVLEEVGRGGMSIVFRGLDLSLDRDVAIKILHSHLSKDEESKTRFQTEARAVARLHHPNIIEIFDFAESQDGLNYIVTEYISGITLRQFMEDHKAYFPEVAIMIAINICKAINHAHNLHIIHRDLKPENIMINDDGVLKLMDFGIAKVIDQQQQMTLTGTILGSPSHMAPELLEGKELDYRSDLFSIGTILYWLATGRLPFTGNNIHQVIKRISDCIYPDPQQVNPFVDSPLKRIILKSLEHSPQNRFQSASEMTAKLQNLLDDLDLGDPDVQLKAYFSNPDAYLAQLQPTLIKILLQKSKTLLQDKKHRQALETLDRLLVLQPNHPETNKLINGINNRVKWQRLIMTSTYTVFLLALFTLGGWTLVSAWPNDDQLPAPPKKHRPEVTKEKTVGKRLSSPLEPTTNKTAENKNKPRPKKYTTPPKEQVAHIPKFHNKVKHKYTIITDPFFDRILISNKVVAQNNKSTKYGYEHTGSLAPGKYKVVIQRKACQDDEFTIKIPKKLDKNKPLEFRRKLLFRPATLEISTDVPQAGVWIDAVFKGYAKDTKQSPITITMKGRRATREVFLRIVDNQAGELKKKITLKAGQKTVFTAHKNDFTAQGKSGGMR